MYQPAHIDGRSVVILRRHGSGYIAEESGFLEFNGEALFLITEGAKRLFSDEEIDSLKVVVEGNRIQECNGFDFFLIT